MCDPHNRELNSCEKLMGLRLDIIFLIIHGIPSIIVLTHQFFLWSQSMFGDLGIFDTMVGRNIFIRENNHVDFRQTRTDFVSSKTIASTRKRYVLNI